MRFWNSRNSRFLLVTLVGLIVGALVVRPMAAKAFGVVQNAVPEIEYRDLGTEITAIYELEGIVFLLSAHRVDDLAELVQYENIQSSRLESLHGDEPVYAQATFKFPLSLGQVEEIVGDGSIVSLRYVSFPEGGGQLPYPLTADHLDTLGEWERDLETDKGEEFRILDGFTAAEIYATPAQLKRIMGARAVFVVDAGPTDLLSEFADAVAVSDDDVGYQYEKFVGSICTVDDLVQMTDQFADDGLIDNRGIHRSLRARLENAKRQLSRERIQPGVNMLEAFIDHVGAQKVKHIEAGAADELMAVADCIVVRTSEGG